eukprot:2167968-Rhodomonas_salina.1
MKQHDNDIKRHGWPPWSIPKPPDPSPSLTVGVITGQCFARAFADSAHNFLVWTLSPQPLANFGPLLPQIELVPESAPPTLIVAHQYLLSKSYDFEYDLGAEGKCASRRPFGGSPVWHVQAYHSHGPRPTYTNEDTIRYASVPQTPKLDVEVPAHAIRSVYACP